MWKRFAKLTGFKLGLLLTIVFCFLKFDVVVLSTWDLHENIEKLILDLKFGTQGAQDPTTFQKNAHVVIAAIDENSLRQLGMWPWPRAKIAELVDNTNQCGARVIGFDVVFAEPDASRTAPIIRKIRGKYGQLATQDESFQKLLDQILHDVEGDKRFAEVLEKYDNVVLGYFCFMNREDLKDLDLSEVVDKAVDVLSFGSGYQIKIEPGTRLEDSAIPMVFGARINQPILSDAVEYYGFFNFEPESDGNFRSSPTLFVLEYEKDGQKYHELFPSLSLQMLALYYGYPIHIYIRGIGYPELFIGPLGPLTAEHKQIPIEPGGRFQLNFYGGSKTFRHISASDLIQKKPEACQAVRDKLVLVGYTGTGLYDLRPTPFEDTFPGVEMHATALENIISDHFLVRPKDLGLLEIVIMFFVGLALSIILSRFRLPIGLIATLLMALCAFIVDFLILFPRGIFSHFFLIYLMMLFQFLAIAVFRYSTEEKQKKETRRAFQYYLSKDVIDDLLHEPSRLKLGGERRELTVLFSDIRGFTTISEGLAPEALTALLNEYLTPMTDLVFEHKGTLDKYMGDAIMAFYGAPVPFADHAKAACNTALRMMATLAKLQVGFEERGLPPIDIGIGVNTGLMSVGNMGSQNRFDYTVMGDHVNLGSRLEGLNKQYGTHIIISRYTQQAIGDDFTCRELDSVAVKGKTEPVQIFELLHAGPRHEDQDGWIDDFRLALEAYRKQDFDQAITLFQAIAQNQQDVASTMYTKRCQEMKTNPPGEGWDGVFRMKTK